MTERILITQPIDASAMALLETEDLEIDVWPGPAPMPGSELRARIRGCAGLISMLLLNNSLDSISEFPNSPNIGSR